MLTGSSSDTQSPNNSMTSLKDQGIIPAFAAGDMERCVRTQRQAVNGDYVFSSGDWSRN